MILLKANGNFRTIHHIRYTSLLYINRLIHLKEKTFMQNHELFESNKKCNDFNKPHPIIAGIVDFYIYSAIIASILAVFITLTGFDTNNERIEMLFLLFAVINVVGLVAFCILYYTVIAHRVKWLSFGEKITGREIHNNCKKWGNAYKANRIGIYIFIFLQVVLLGSSFDSISNGIVYTVPILIGKLINMIMIIYGLTLIGKGSLSKGISIFVVIHLFTIVAAYIIKDIYSIGFMICLLIVDIVLYFLYRTHLKRAIDTEKNIQTDFRNDV